MKIFIKCKELLDSLQKVAGVIEKAHTIKILSNVLIRTENDLVTFVATDSDIQIVDKAHATIGEKGELTVSGRKLIDICKFLPDQSEISLYGYNDKLEIKCNSSNFVLKTLPADNFPTLKEIEDFCEIVVRPVDFKKALDNTLFSMGLQDVRSFLNGLYIRAEKQSLTLVASDGHRLATTEAKLEDTLSQTLETIVPRKAALELVRLIGEKETKTIKLKFSKRFMLAEVGKLVFMGKVLDCKFPNYRNVIPPFSESIIKIDARGFKEALGRVSILSNEISRGVLFNIGKNEVVLTSHNNEQEQATEAVQIEYDGDPIALGFNSSYVIDALKRITSERVFVNINGERKSMTIAEGNDSFEKFLVMPMKI